MVGFDSTATEFEVGTIPQITTLINTLRKNGGGGHVKKLTITFLFPDKPKNVQSKRGPAMAKLLELTPNLITLNLNFAGHLGHWDDGPNKYKEDSVGNELRDAMCTLQNLEEFSHKGNSTTCSAFISPVTLVKLISSWPKLRSLHVAASTEFESADLGDLSTLSPVPVSRSLEFVTFENLAGDYSKMVPFFSALSASLTHFEARACGNGKIDDVLRPMLHSIKYICVGTSWFTQPSKDFIMNELSKAPCLEVIKIKGSADHEKSADLRLAFAEALGKEGAFPALLVLMCPGVDRDVTKISGTRENKCKYVKVDHRGKKELGEVTKARGISLEIVEEDLEYEIKDAKIEGVKAPLKRKRG